jgi:hypothetical protein
MFKITMLNLNQYYIVPEEEPGREKEFARHGITFLDALEPAKSTCVNLI